MCFRIPIFTFHVLLHALQIMITTCALTWDLDTLVLKIRTNPYNIEGNWKYVKFLFQFWNAAWVSGKKIHMKAASLQGYEKIWKGSTSPQEYASLWYSSVTQNIGFFGGPGSHQVKQVDNENMVWNFQNFLILNFWQHSHMDNNLLYQRCNWRGRRHSLSKDRFCIGTFQVCQIAGVVGNLERHWAKNLWSSSTN